MVNVSQLSRGSLLLAGAVFLPRTGELWGLMRGPGRRGVVAMLGLTALLRASPRVRSMLERSLPVWLVPTTSTLLLLVAAVLRRSIGGASSAAHLLRRLLVLVAPLSLAQGLDNLEEADSIALLGLVLGVGLRQEFSATVLLLMLTGGEALEEYAKARARLALGLIIRRRMPATVRRLLRASDDATRAAGASRGHLCDFEEVDLEQIGPEDHLLLREGEVVPADCVLVSGRCVVDESTVTGEFALQEKRAATVPTLGAPSGGDDHLLVQSGVPLVSRGAPGALASPSPCLISGSVLGTTEGAIAVRVTRAPRDSTLALMAAALRRCEDRTAPLESRAARLAALFAPLTIAAASLSLLHLRARGYPARVQWATVLSVLTASTSCPLAIGVPVSLLSGMSVARKAGMTIKCGEALEGLGSATMVVLDKTGTLTTGQPEVAAVCSLCRVQRQDAAGDDGVVVGRQPTASEVLAVAHAIECSSSHVLAKAIRRHARRRCREEGAGSDIACPLLEVLPASLTGTPGKGVSGMVTPLPPFMLRTTTTGPTIDTAAQAGPTAATHGFGPSGGVVVHLGSAAHLEDCGVDMRDLDADEALRAAVVEGDPLEAGQSGSHIPVFLAVAHRLVGCILFRDTLRPEASQLVRALKRRRLRLAILSGDRSNRLTQVAAELGIEASGMVRSVPLPVVQEAVACLPHEKAAHIERWRQQGECVVMVGDGLNDTPALAAANVGISMGTTALASDSADVVLLAAGGSEDDTADVLSEVVTALDLGNAVVATARRGVLGGMGCSLVQMALAHLGVLPPLVNACLQEAVDLGALLNALSILLWRPPVFPATP